MSRRASRHVLVIDDEADLVAMLSARLGRAGYRVSTAGDGLEGLRKAAELKPSAVVLDLAMPKLDGWGFCRRLRGVPGLRDTPVLILTAWLSDDLKRKADSARAAAIMLKPYDERELLKRLNDMTGGHA